MADEAKLSCGHPQAEEAEPDGLVWCLVCAMYVGEPQAPAIDALVSSSSEMAYREAFERIRELAKAREFKKAECLDLISEICDGALGEAP